VDTKILTEAANQLVVKTFTSTTSASAPAAFRIMCQRSGADYNAARNRFAQHNMQTLDSGSFTPTFSNATNFGALTNLAGSYVRIGEKVIVSGGFTGTASTGSGTATSVEMEVPVTPKGGTFAASWSANGVGTFGTGGVAIRVRATTGTNRVVLLWPANSTATTASTFQFMYDAE
jgi:hypothetical protein